MTLIPAFPLGTAFLPGEAVVLRVFESRYLDLVRVALENDRTFVTSLISAGSEVGGGDKRFDTGVLVQIDHVEPADFGLMLYGHAVKPLNISAWNDEASYPRASCHDQTSTTTGLSSPELMNLLSSLVRNLENFFSFLTEMKIPSPIASGFVSSLLPADVNVLSAEESAHLFWTLVRLLPSTPLARYELLIDQPLTERVKRALDEIEHLREIVVFRYGN